MNDHFKISCSLGIVCLCLSSCSSPPLGNGKEDLTPQGAACDATSRCDSGFCKDRVCVAYVADGATCSRSAECASAFCSVAGLCRTLGQAGDDCSSTGCDTSLYCGSDKRCAALKQNGLACDGDGQCASGHCGQGHCAPADVCAAFDPWDYPTLTTGCDLGATAATRLFVTTTDFNTGAVSAAVCASRTVQADLAVGSTDGVPFYHDGKIYVVHRFGADYIDIKNASDYSQIGQFAVASTDITSPNPQAIAFNSEGLGFVTALGHPEVLVFDFGRAAAEANVARIALGRFADPDGNPDATHAVACGDTLFVILRRLDQNWATVGCELLVAIDSRTRRVYGSAMPLLGKYTKQLRLDPKDPSGHTLLLLTTGIERVNLETGAVTWAVPESMFTAAGLGMYDIYSFAVTADGNSAYIVAAPMPPAEGGLWRVSLDGAPNLTKVVAGGGALERTLEIVQGELWFGDTTNGASGLRVFDITQNPPALLAGPLSTGLPPYSMVPLP